MNNEFTFEIPILKSKFDIDLLNEFLEECRNRGGDTGKEALDYIKGTSEYAVRRLNCLKKDESLIIKKEREDCVNYSLYIRKYRPSIHTINETIPRWNDFKVCELEDEQRKEYTSRISDYDNISIIFDKTIVKRLRYFANYIDGNFHMYIDGEKYNPYFGYDGDDDDYSDLTLVKITIRVNSWNCYLCNHENPPNKDECEECNASKVKHKPFSYHKVSKSKEELEREAIEKDYYSQWRVFEETGIPSDEYDFPD